MSLTEKVLSADAGADFSVPTKTLLTAVSFLYASARGVPTSFGESIVTIEALAEETPHLLLHITVPDARFCLTVFKDVEVIEEGKLGLETAQLFQMLKSSSAEKAAISVLDDATARVRIGRSIWSPSTQPTEDWDSEELEWQGVLDAKTFSNALTVVSGAMPTAAGRPALHRVEVRDGIAEATDGTLLLKAGIGTTHSLSIPKPIAKQLSSLTTEGDIDLRSDSKKFSLRAKGVHVLIEKPISSYPETGKLLGAASLSDSGLLLAEPLELLGALKRVRVYADPFDNSVRIRSVKVKDQWRVIMLATDRGGNLSKEVLTASWQHDERMDASVDARRLETLLKASLKAGLDTLRLHVGFDGGALWVSEEDEDFSAVLQQMT